MRTAPLLALLLACGGIPEVCGEMCEGATAVQARCLGDQTWTDLGFEDAADHLAWCETWVWEQRLLERDAGESGRTRDFCEDRSSTVSELSCEAYDALPW